MSRQEALQVVRAAAQEAASAGELSAFLGELERVRVEAVLAATAPGPTPTAALSMRDAAKAVGWTYDTFRKEPTFRAANLAPQGRHPRYDRAKVERIAANLRKR